MLTKKKLYLLYILLSLFLIFCSSFVYALKANGKSCTKWTGDNECESGNCGKAGDSYICCFKDPDYAHNDCCLTDSSCGSDMTCKTPDYTCHWKCEYITGGCCFKDSDCPSGYECNQYASTEWKWGECKYVGTTPTPSAYCGDGSCNSGETCSSCSSDCGSCEEPTKEDGEYCDLNYECESGNCENNVCCMNERVCCDDDNDCVSSVGPGRWCSTSDHFCLEPESESGCETVICSAGYKCVNGDCISTGTKQFCQQCTGNSDCASGFCLDFSDGLNKCTNLARTITCCGDGKAIENFKIGVNCCEDTGCNSGYKCTNYKCVLNLLTTPEKKANGERCKSDSECQSGNCNWQSLEPDPNLYDGACCQPGKDCCDEVGSTTSFPGEEGWYECNSEYYLFKQETVKTQSDSTQTEIKDATGIVVSFQPEGDPEGMSVKEMIEQDIYPELVKIFDEDSSKVFTGPREYDSNIKLRMTDKETVAMWDESTNVMTIPYRNMYENFGSFSSKNMQLNGIAHELTHYHFNGFALKEGGDFKKIPLWFREGIAEYGAHKYYKKHLQSEVPPWSVSESRSNIFVNYLATNQELYKETVQKNAVDKISWKSERDWDKSVNQNNHVYYGAVFNFMDYFLSKDNPIKDVSMTDILKYMFIKGSQGRFKFYGGVDSEQVAITEQNIKNDWFNDLDTNHKITENLGNKPPNIVKRFFTGVGNFFRSLFGG